MLTFKKLNQILSNENFKNLKIYNNEKYLGIGTAKKSLYLLVNKLRDIEQLKFNQLIDVTAIDYPSREFRFEIIYIFLSLKLNERILIKVPLKENETIDSISSLYKSANWYERECYDLFGIKFLNHPDMRRRMTDYNFEGHPLRKDFPLTGNTEVRYDNLEKKVVYEPVNLPQEYRNFDYTSPWEGLPNELKGDEKATKENK